MINAEDELAFTVANEKDAKARLGDWYIDYIYVG